MFFPPSFFLVGSAALHHHNSRPALSYFNHVFFVLFFDFVFLPSDIGRKSTPFALLLLPAGSLYNKQYLLTF
jgi:hypothetical protein